MQLIILSVNRKRLNVYETIKAENLSSSLFVTHCSIARQFSKHFWSNLFLLFIWLFEVLIRGFQREIVETDH